MSIQPALRRVLVCLGVAIAIDAGVPAHGQEPIGQATMYRGFLSNAGTPANGVHDFRFQLYDASTGGNAVGSLLCSENVIVTDGDFTVQLDIGDLFNGQKRYLQVAARVDTGLLCGDGTGFVNLTPRQELSPLPYAHFARRAADAVSLNGQTSTFFQNAANLTFGTLSTSRLPLPLLISGSSASATLRGDNTSTTIVRATGVYGRAAGTSLLHYGVYGEGTGTAGRGVYGRASSPSGVTHGVIGESLSSQGRGVWGTNPNTTSGGPTYGGFFEVLSPNGRAVYGEARATSGSPRAVSGHSASPLGHAAYFTGGRNFFEQKVGIGTSAPEEALHIAMAGGGIKFPDGSVQRSAASGTGSVTWQSITNKPAGFADDTDNDTTFSAGNGLQLIGTAFSLAQQSASDGQVLKWSNAQGRWLPGNDLTGGGGGSYIAGTGLLLSSNTFSLDTGFADGRYWRRADALSGDTVGQPSGVTVIKLQGLSVSSASPSPGQVLKWSGSAWTPSGDDTGETGDHGSLGGLLDDDHPQYMPVTRSNPGFVQCAFTGRLDLVQAPGGQRMIKFYDPNNTDCGRLTITDGTTLTLLAKNSPLYLRTDIGVDVLREGSGYSTVRAAAFTVSSSRAFKDEIRYFSTTQSDAWLKRVRQLRPAEYRRTDEVNPITSTRHIGFIAEELPAELLGPNGDAVDLYALTTSLAAALQALSAKVDEQSKMIEQLQRSAGSEDATGFAPN